MIVSAPPGYRLRLSEEDVDAWRLPGLIDAAGKALQQGAAAAAHDLLDEALGLWTGSAYGSSPRSGRCRRRPGWPSCG